jgi:hypothetical protein
LTSNGTHDLSDALRRRCLYHYVDYPSVPQEIEIVKKLVPDAYISLVQQAVTFVHKLRQQDLEKVPSIAETLDWVRALCALRMKDLPDQPEALHACLAALLKTRADQWQMGQEVIVRLQGEARVGVDVGVAGSPPRRARLGVCCQRWLRHRSAAGRRARDPGDQAARGDAVLAAPDARVAGLGGDAAQ